MLNKKEEIRGHIRKRYAGVAVNASRGCGCGSGCCEGNQNTLDYNSKYIEEVSSKIGCTESDFASVPEEANVGLGCGNPTSFYIIGILGCVGGTGNYDEVYG